MSLAELLGVDPENFEWEDLGTCKGMSFADFYDKYESDSVHARQVDEMCLRCPVIAQCSMRGQDGEYGVWGGIYWNGAGSPDESKNAHKTEEVWDRIKKRITEHGE